MNVTKHKVALHAQRLQFDRGLTTGLFRPLRWATSDLGQSHHFEVFVFLEQRMVESQHKFP